MKRDLGLRSLAPVVAAALCIPCIVLSVIFAWRLHTREGAHDAGQDALRAARSTATQLLAYNYQHITDDIAASKRLITQPFSGQYAESTTTLQTEAVQLKAIVTADVKSAAVVDASRNRAVVLLFVDQSSVKQLPGQTRPVARRDEQRVRMTMVRSHGHWLVSELSALL